MASLITLPTELLLQIAQQILNVDYTPCDTGTWVYTPCDVRAGREIVTWRSNYTFSPPVKTLYALACAHPTLQSILLPTFFKHGARYSIWGRTLFYDFTTRPTRLPILRALIAHGADVNARDRRTGLTPLLEAASHGRVEHARLFLESGADPGVLTTCDKLYTALHLAVSLGHVAMVAFLIEKCGHTAVNERNGTGWTPLHIAADRGFVEMVSLLLSKGADHSAMLRERETPLGVAVGAGNIEVVKLLISAGADVDKGLTQAPLHTAAANGDVECCRVLVQMGKADVNKLGLDFLTPVQIAAGLEDEGVALGVVRELLRGHEKAEFCRATTKMQAAAVLVAAQKGHANVLREMMERDTDAVEVYRRAVVNGEVRALRDGVFLHKWSKGRKGEQKGKWCDYTEIVPLREQYAWRSVGRGYYSGFGFEIRGQDRSALARMIFEWRKSAGEII